MAEDSHSSPNVPPEPWVDAKTLAAHLACHTSHVRKMAEAGRIPGHALANGARTFWRFKISEVDAFMAGSNMRKVVAA